MIRKYLLKLLSFYQRFLTLFGRGSCRFYPTCSEYAKWEFENNSLFSAFFSTTFRILRCNQLFEGGIDYPKAHKCYKSKPLHKKIIIKYWFVPDGKNHCFIIKNFDYKK